jgi:hypothetical protein
MKLQHVIQMIGLVLICGGPFLTLNERAFHSITWAIRWPDFAWIVLGYGLFALGWFMMYLSTKVEDWHDFLSQWHRRRRVLVQLQAVPRPV